MVELSWAMAAAYHHSQHFNVERNRNQNRNNAHGCISLMARVGSAWV